MILTYFIIAGLFFLVLYGLNRKIMFSRKIQQYYPSGKVHWREIRNSAVSSVIFSAISIISVHSSTLNSHSAYHFFGAYCQNWLMIPILYLLMFLLHDTYFYWTHRLVHHRWLFRWVHLTHHRSSSPSPWTAFSFSPVEALIQVGIVPILLLIIPLSPMHINIFFIFSLIYNIYGHSGFELYPRNFCRHWLGKILNTAVHHDLHHLEGGKCSFGLYLLLWDRWMGTRSPKYHQSYDSVTSRKCS